MHFFAFLLQWSRSRHVRKKLLVESVRYVTLNNTLGDVYMHLLSQIVVKNGRDAPCRTSAHTSCKMRLPDSESDGAVYPRNKESDKEAKQIYKKALLFPNFWIDDHDEQTRIDDATENTEGCPNDIKNWWFFISLNRSYWVTIIFFKENKWWW